MSAQTGWDGGNGANKHNGSHFVAGDGVRSDALGPTDFRHHLHGDDRQPTIWLDAVRQPDRSEVPLGARGDSSRVHDLRSHRNLAGAVRGLPDRQVWPARDGVRQRLPGRDRMDDERLCRFSCTALPRRGDRRHRCRRHLRRLGRQRAQVVPRPPRACRGPDGGGFRRRFGADGLMAIAQLACIVNDLKIAGVAVSILGLTLPAVTFALTIDRVLNGICRPFFGWVSDRIGRENTMFIAFFIEGIGIYALLYFASNPFLFVILSGLVFFAWGEIYSLFPATCTDIYGRKFATTNYGMLYTAKGTASLLVPLANVLTTATASAPAVFYVPASLNIIAAGTV